MPLSMNSCEPLNAPSLPRRQQDVFNRDELTELVVHAEVLARDQTLMIIGLSSRGDSTHLSNGSQTVIRSDSSFATADGDSSWSVKAEEMTGPPSPGRRSPGTERRYSRRNISRQIQHPASASTFYPITSPTVLSDTVDIRVVAGSSDFHATPPAHFQRPSASYERRSSYAGQYMMSAQSPVSMAHTPPPFSYGPKFGHHVAHPPESLMSPTLPTNFQPSASFQPVLQSHALVYPYQSLPFPGGPSSNQPAHSNTSYGHHPVSASPPHITHSSILSSNLPMAPRSASPFMHSSPYHTLASPPNPLYAHAPQSFKTHPQYPPSAYQAHFVSPHSQEGQGSWLYFPHSSSMQSSCKSPHVPHAGPYPLNYPGHEAKGYSQAPLRTGPSAAYPPASPSHNVRLSPIEAPCSTSPMASALPTTILSFESREERPLIRKQYHPNPPARSDFVMWVGNVPSNTTRDELWQFFSQPPPVASNSGLRPDDTESNANSNSACRVVSVFLISRSNCAFVNFDTRAHLETAITRFQGKPLRPMNPKCPRLVCRERKKEDDLTAGVGGQRGMGLHTRWVKEVKEKRREASPISQRPPSPLARSPSDSSNLGTAISVPVSFSSGDDDVHAHRKTPRSSSSGSYTSTNSSLLVKYFPKRYFILKSLSQYDLDLSVERGLWATQPHNESILHQAYRTSKEVYLIFGVNKSGEFYGYARMAGPVVPGEQNVPWASRTSSSVSSSQSSRSSTHKSAAAQRSLIPEEPEGFARPSSSSQPSESFFPSPEQRQVEESPVPLSSPEATIPSGSSALRNNLSGDQVEFKSAPAVLGGPPYPKLSYDEVMRMHTVDFIDTASQDLQSLPASSPEPPREERQGPRSAFELEPDAPARAVRPHWYNNMPMAKAGGPSSGLQTVKEAVEAEVPKNDVVSKTVKAPLSSTETAERLDIAREESWGKPFRVEWLCTERLPFQQTRHIRNAWNHDREVKVSRDGTELMPSTGQALLDEWQRYLQSAKVLAPTKVA